MRTDWRARWVVIDVRRQTFGIKKCYEVKKKYQYIFDFQIFYFFYVRIIRAVLVTAIFKSVHQMLESSIQYCLSKQEGQISVSWWNLDAQYKFRSLSEPGLSYLEANSSLLNWCSYTVLNLHGSDWTSNYRTALLGIICLRQRLNGPWGLYKVLPWSIPFAFIVSPHEGHNVTSKCQP
jgi:hypothetical protein